MIDICIESDFSQRHGRVEKVDAGYADEFCIRFCLPLAARRSHADMVASIGEAVGKPFHVIFNSAKVGRKVGR
jgi:hypothetical protein